MTPYPLQFRPLLKQTIWGGRRLGDRLGKPLGDASNYAESWEVVDHGTDQSVVTKGPLSGKTLSELILQDRKWLLGDSKEPLGGQADPDAFPLLFKYLDCHRVLSVQVHPDDTYAAKMNPPDLGKTEAWYIVESDAGALVYAGLKSGVDRVALHEAIGAGQTEQVLHSFHPDAGDIVFIPAGTVHALGAGLLVAEIQQSSDTTFRLFDWNRVDDQGKARPLHVDQSLEVSDYQSGPVQAMASNGETVGWQTMVTCEKFILQLMRSGEGEIGGDGKFHIVTVPSGQAVLQTPSDTMTLPTGATVMLPAAMGRCTLRIDPPRENHEAMSTILASHLPDFPAASA